MNKANIAILGASGIGKVHARIFHNLGANVNSILGSNKESVSKTCADLESMYGIKAKGYTCIKDILEQHPDAVSICTPPSLHFEHIFPFFEKNIPVFCEKPIFWDKHLSICANENKINCLEQHQSSKLLVNASNSVFIDAILNNFDVEKNCKTFSFHFYTRGKYRGIDIAIDLFPHGFSVLLSLFGSKKIYDFKYKVTEHQFECTFNYDNKIIEFIFKEDPNGPKCLSFKFDDKEFYRVQEGYEDTYKVYIESLASHKRIEIDDPFTSYIKYFLDNYLEKIESHNIHNDSFVNIRLMLECMKKINNNIVKL